MSQVEQHRQPRAARPSTVQVKGRNLKFLPDAKFPRYWVGDDPFLTHFMNALSITFPRGERFFIESVKAVREQVKSPATRADVAGFIAQEALHSREHGTLNDVLHEAGYPARELEQAFSDLQDRRKRSHSKKTALALTAAVEHLTALFGRTLLEHREMREMIHPELRAMWMWHAMEELEHKAVAFDVYQEVFDDYLVRAATLLAGTFAVFSFTHYAQYRLLKHDGLAHRPWMWAKGLWQLWGPVGIITPNLVTWLSYLRPDFHPWQDDDSALITEFEPYIEPSTSPPAS